ncbi:SIMPL domain-containing protein [Bacteroidia bacterium]|nr:SIMPL domain-containing protein [Bacteroidia bacterium]MDC1395468.1 SIMPL domain-containing protein [Bacteroidia bacterium]
MKKYFKIVLASLILFAATQLTAQNVNTKPFIEIVGKSEIKVIPNQIFISITLSENIEKSSRSIEIQEQKLLAELKKSGINTEKLVIANASPYYGKSVWLSKDVVKSKSYELEVSSATEAGKTFEALSRLNIKNARITRTDHTDMDNYRKQARIEAIKAAKDKASYMLEAIEEELGQPLIINEQNTGHRPQMMYANAKMDKAESAYGGGAPMVDSFKEILITSSIYNKWQIGK